MTDKVSGACPSETAAFVPSGSSPVPGLAADAHQSTGGWLPIETAPKNWEPVLVWAISEDEKEDAEDDEREPERQMLIARHSTIQPGNWWLNGSPMTRVCDPTHWQALPEPPQ